MSITFDELEVEPGDEQPGRGTRRAIAVVGAVVLIAAAVGVGYGVGRSTDDASAERVAGAGDATAAGRAETVPSTATENTTATDDAEAPVETFRITGSGSDVASAEMQSSALDMASGGIGYTAFGSQPMELLAERLTPDGFLIRAHLGETWDGPEVWASDGWQPAPWCYESGQLRISLSGNGVVDVGGVPWYRQAFEDRAVSRVMLGVVDGRPQWVVVVQTPPDTTAVTVTFADGAVDTATPQGGLALMTVPALPPEEQVTGDGHTFFVEPAAEFTVDFQGGAAPTVVASNETGNWDDPEFRASCEPPPPALPDPGVQPADPAAGEAAITMAMTELYDSSVRGEGDIHLDDPTGVVEARDQIAEGVYADAAESAQAVVEELVFTSPTEAWFRYRIESSNGTFAARYGVAVVLGGTWKITRNTVCQDLSLAGGDCGGGWEMVQPPSVSTGGGRSEVGD